MLKQTHKDWLMNRGITEDILNRFDIHSAYNRIVIPIKDASGITLYNKYRRDPTEINGSKYTYDVGASIKLFNIGILQNSKRVIICEGELDALLLISKGFDAVTSTGGAVSFQKDWIPFFADKEIFICLDNDKAGMNGTMKISTMLPTAKILPLPSEIGEHGDITDFFMKLGKSVGDLEDLMSVAFAPEVKVDLSPPTQAKRTVKGPRVEQAKAVPIDDLLRFNSMGKAKCPFHGDDSTPSLQKYKDNTWYCFGCGAGRDTIDFVMKRDNVGFKEAVSILID